jgi:hypothetical protein
MEDFTQDPEQPHEHSCGTTATGKILGYGCGHTWTHEGIRNVSNKYRANMHMCPSCGRGPWFYVISRGK